MAQRDRTGELGLNSGLFALPTEPSASLSSVTEPMMCLSLPVTMTSENRVTYRVSPASSSGPGPKWELHASLLI